MTQLTHATEVFASNSTAPIALFVYNRPDHTRQTIEALQQNVLALDSNLFIYSDAPKNPTAAAQVEEVRRFVKGLSGFRSVTVVEREKNWGVDPSIIDGVTVLCEKYGHVIVLEDDLVTSPWFLTFMNESLSRYRDDERVMQVGGFMFPLDGVDESKASFLPYVTCWGWATWKRAWDQFDATAAGYAFLKADESRRRAFDLNGAYFYFDLLQSYIDGKTDAWDIRWYLSVFLKDGLALFPNKTLVRNIGFDGTGTHDSPTVFSGDQLNAGKVEKFPSIVMDARIWKAIESYLKAQRRSPFKNMVSRMFRWA